MRRTFTWPDYPGSSLTATGSVSTVGNTMTYTMDLTGTYNGPTDLVATSNYRTRWRNSSPGSMIEVGSATVHRSNGQTFQVLISTVFTGLSDSLAVDQVGSMTPLQLTFNPATGQYFLNWTALQSPELVVNATFSAGNLTMSWTGGGVLQESSDLVNWSVVPGAVSPFTVMPVSPKKFYRVRQ